VAGVHRRFYRLYGALIRRLAAEARATRRRMATVEWGTGGRLASVLTAPPGASAYFLGGLVLPQKPSAFDFTAFGRRLGADLVVVFDGLADPPQLFLTEPTSGQTPPVE
jgi:hypothetical protein